MSVRDMSINQIAELFLHALGISDTQMINKEDDPMQKYTRFIEKKMVLLNLAKKKDPEAAMVAWKAFLNAVKRESRPLTAGAIKKLEMIAGV